MLRAKISKMYRVDIIDESGNVIEVPGDYDEDVVTASVDVNGNKQEAIEEAKELLAWTRAKLGRK